MEPSLRPVSSRCGLIDATIALTPRLEHVLLVGRVHRTLQRGQERRPLSAAVQQQGRAAGDARNRQAPATSSGVAIRCSGTVPATAASPASLPYAATADSVITRLGTTQLTRTFGAHSTARLVARWCRPALAAP